VKTKVKPGEKTRERQKGKIVPPKPRKIGPGKTKDPPNRARQKTVDSPRAKKKNEKGG